MTTIAKVLLAAPDMKQVFAALRSTGKNTPPAKVRNRPRGLNINWPENRWIRPAGRQPQDPHGAYGAGDWEDPLLLEFRRKW